MSVIPIILLLSCDGNSPVGDSAPSETGASTPLQEGVWRIAPTSATKNTCGATKENMGIGKSVLSRLTLSEDGSTFTLDDVKGEAEATVYTFEGADRFARTADYSDPVSVDCVVETHYQFDGVVLSDTAAAVTSDIHQEAKGSCWGVPGLPSACEIIIEVSWTFESE